MKRPFICVMFFLSLLQFALAQPKYEFRAAWIATVDNIDWPSKAARGNTELQKQEFTRILDMHQRNGLNAVVVQVRPATDAFYPSQYEPWSEWLTGKQGQPPMPYYDPLEFMISETHKRGMEFHAWFNPYRAVFNVKTSSIAPNHISRIHPEWFLTYGDKKYFDPGNPEGRKFVVNIIRDVVNRYELDAVHFDDYFYPYRISGKEFPDNNSFAKYGNGMSKDDWRRSNVDSIILQLSTTIKAVNPRVRFGISPFGVWRNSDKDPAGSKTKAGQTNYDDLYADILLWLKKGWIDYVAPQLYWEIGHKLADYTELIDWWSRNAYGKHLYIGHGLYRAIERPTAAWRNKSELPDQITLLRDYPEVQGSIYFNSKNFESNPNGWNDSLRNNYYKYPALVPPMPWLDSIAPIAPQLRGAAVEKEGLRISGNILRKSEPVKAFVLYRFPKGSDMNTGDAKLIRRIIPANQQFELLEPLPTEGTEYIYAITSIDLVNNESPISNTVKIQYRNGGWWME